MHPRLAAVVSLALLIGAGGGSAEAETKRPLALTFRPRLQPSQGLSIPPPVGPSFTLVLREPPPFASRYGATEEGMYAPLRGAWTGVTERCGARICETDSGPKTGVADEALAQLGVLTVLLSAFVPKGEVFAIRSELTGQKVRFTPTTFAATGAGLRVWGTF